MSRPVVPDFDAVYAADRDPWRVGTSSYERRKQQIVLAVLASPRYAHAWDPACGTGHLVAKLAGRCARVLATDTSAAAVALTKALCADRAEVVVGQLRLPAEPGHRPVTGFDLVVLAEFLYYLGRADRGAALRVVARCSAPGAEVLAVHWRARPHDGWLSGADVQVEIGHALSSLGWKGVVHLDDPDFVLDTWRRSAEPT